MPENFEDNQLFRLMRTKAKQFKGTPISYIEFEAVVRSSAKEFANELNRACITFPDYTLHDSDHAFRVCMLMHLLLPPKVQKSLNVIEVGLLILSAYGHDIGMAVARSQRTLLEGSLEYRTFVLENEDRWLAAQDAESNGRASDAEFLRSLLFQDFLRGIHHRESAEKIRGKYNASLTVCGNSLAHAIAQLSQSHGEPITFVSKLTDWPVAAKFKCDLAFLAVLLRLADYLDLDPARAPESLIGLLERDNERGRREWLKHRAALFFVSPVEIRFSALFTDYFEEKALRDTLDGIEAERRMCIDFLNSRSADRYRLSLSNPLISEIRSKGYIFEKFRFSLEYHEIFSLLMGTRLYSDERIFIRELIQNALDACRFAEAANKRDNRGYEGRIIVRQRASIEHPKLGKNLTVIEVSDNGAGMTRAIISNYFMRIGKSYYRSFAFRRKELAMAPVSEFGIGILSCFIVAEYLEVETQRDPHAHPDVPDDEPRRLLLEIRGPSEYFVVRDLNPERAGTTVRLYLSQTLIPTLRDLVERFVARIPYTVELHDRDKQPEVLRSEPFDFSRLGQQLAKYPEAFGYAHRDVCFEGLFGRELHGAIRVYMFEVDGRRHIKLNNVGYFAIVGFSATGTTVVNPVVLTDELFKEVLSHLMTVQGALGDFAGSAKEDLRGIIRCFRQIGDILLTGDRSDQGAVLWNSVKAQINALKLNSGFNASPLSRPVIGELAQARDKLKAFVGGQIQVAQPTGILTQDGIRVDDMLDLRSELRLGIGYLYNLDLCGEYRVSLNAARNQVLHDKKLAALVIHIHKRVGRCLGDWFAEEGIPRDQVQRHCQGLPGTLSEELFNAYSTRLSK